MSDRDKCDICGEPLLGGDDVVAFLKSPFDSFHHHKHLRCHDAAEREACAQVALAYPSRWAEPDGAGDIRKLAAAEIAYSIRKRSET